MRRGLALIILGVAIALAAAPGSYALLAQEPVKTTRFYEQLPAAATAGGVKYFAWTQNTRAHPHRNDAFLRRGSEAKVTLNRAGHGYVGGIDPPRVVYQQVVGGQSNLKIYDADQHTRMSPPAGVNTSDWEWEPSISDDWLLYGRKDRESNRQWVLLRSLTSSTWVVLDQGSGFRHPGQLNGDYAVWTRCAATCDVVRRQISTSLNATLAEPSTTTFQYGAAVTSTGIVYVARSGRNCGSSVRIVRYFGSGDPTQGTVVARLGRGRELWSAYARENGDGSVDVFYDRYRCAGGVGDIYRVHDPAPGP
jgi:hypothetical protein